MRGNTDVHRTESGGEFIDLGGLRRMVHGRRWSERLVLKIELDLDAEDLPDFSVDAELIDLLAFDQEKITSRVNRAWVELTIGEFSSDPHIVSYAIGINGEPLATVKSSQREPFVKLTDIAWHHPIFLSTEEQQFAEVARQAELMRKAAAQAGHPVETRAESLKDEAQQEVRGALVELFEQAGETLSSGLELQVAIPPGHHLRRALPVWDRPLEINFPSGEISFADTVLTCDPKRGAEVSDSRRREITDRLAARAAFTEVMSKLIVGVGQCVRDELEAFRYLGPLRTIPPRHRDVIDPVGPSRWPNGLAAWDLLNQWDETLRKEVSDWMWRDDRLATGYQVERIEFREISAGLQRRMLNVMPTDDADLHGSEFEQVSLEADDVPEESKVVLLDLAKDLRLDAHDVGVGISQVVPVVVAILAPDSTLVAVEQPELHVHPRVQVAMGDLMILAALGDQVAAANSRRLLIETHSEHLLLRLLKRIRETASNTLPPGSRPITPADLAVVYIEPGEDGARVKPLRVDDNGEFLDAWPQGFFAERGEELFG